MLQNCVFFITAVTVFGMVSAEVVRSGRCPSDVEVMRDFQVEKYIGVWYEFARYPNAFETNGKCNIAFYSPEGDNRVGVYNSMINNKTGNLEYVLGYAVPVENAKLKVVFPGTPTNAASNYWILETDYTTYSCVYSCQPLPLSHITYAWILTRDKFPKMETVQKCIDVFTRYSFYQQPLTQTTQTDC